MHFKLDILVRSPKARYLWNVTQDIFIFFTASFYTHLCDGILLKKRKRKWNQKFLKFLLFCKCKNTLFFMEFLTFLKTKYQFFLRLNRFVKYLNSRCFNIPNFWNCFFWSFDICAGEIYNVNFNKLFYCNFKFWINFKKDSKNFLIFIFAIYPLIL